jgi:hypothetical protein
MPCPKKRAKFIKRLRARMGADRFSLSALPDEIKKHIDLKPKKYKDKGMFSAFWASFAKKYLKKGEKPPKGAAVKRGPKGGAYYESSAKGQPQAKPQGKGKPQAKKVGNEFPYKGSDIGVIQNPDGFYAATVDGSEILVRANSVKDAHKIAKRYIDMDSARSPPKQAPAKKPSEGKPIWKLTRTSS